MHYVIYANHELNIWLKPNNSMFFIRWLKPTVIDNYYYRFIIRLLKQTDNEANKSIRALAQNFKEYIQPLIRIILK